MQDQRALVHILQNCRKTKNLGYAKHMHDKICDSWLEAVNIGNHAVPMFVECGSVVDAHRTFNSLLNRNEHSWTSLILGYIEYGQSEDTFALYQKMQEEKVHPSSYTLKALLKAAARLRDVEAARKLHIEVVQSGYESDPHMGSALVGMYAKCGLLKEAHEAFDKLTVRDVVSWTALLAGYAENGSGQRALQCLEQMQLDNVLPDSVTFVFSLKSCSSIGAVAKGREIHTYIIAQGFERGPSVGNALIDMYIKCGLLKDAQEVFDRLQIRDSMSWNALIIGYAETGFGQEALKCVEQMELEGLYPDAVTFVGCLKACCTIGVLALGREIHNEIARRGLDTNLYIGNTLVDMYAKCGSLAEARQVFQNLSVRDVVTWNALIAGYTENALGHEALKCFDEMQLEDVPSDALTLLCSLKACISIGAIDKGRKIHQMAVQSGLERNIHVGNALIDMYAKSGSPQEAFKVFVKLPVRDLVSWNALIAGYVENGLAHEALNCFEKMQEEGMVPNAITFVCSLKACGSTGALDKGQELHFQIAQNGLERNAFVGNTLVDMYAKCGSLENARKVFDALPIQDMVSWHVMLRGYAINNDVNMAIQCYECMQENGVNPNAITFLCLLTSCSRANLLFKAREYFMVMEEEYYIAPTADHCTCMVDLLARSGHLYEAEQLLETAPCHQSTDAWTSLLSACKNYGGDEMGWRCFEQLAEMNQGNATPYVLMANVIVDKWGDANKIEEMRKNAGEINKDAGEFIEVDKAMHEYIDAPEILETLSSRMVKKDILQLQTYEGSLDEKDSAAIVFGQTLHMTKNLKMCNDYHCSAS